MWLIIISIKRSWVWITKWIIGDFLLQSVDPVFYLIIMSQNKSFSESNIFLLFGRILNFKYFSDGDYVETSYLNEVCSLTSRLELTLDLMSKKNNKKISRKTLLKSLNNFIILYPLIIFLWKLKCFSLSLLEV